MAPASEAQRAQMRRDVEEVEGQFLRGMAKQGLSLNVSLLLSPLTSLYDLASGNTQRVVEGMEAERQTLVTWRTRWKAWAEAGQREDGSRYTFEQWQDVGRSIATSILFWTGEAVGRNAFVLVRQAATDAATTVVQTAEAAEAVLEALPTLPTPRDLERFKTMALWGGGAVLGALLLVAGGYAVRSVR